MTKKERLEAVHQQQITPEAKAYLDWKEELRADPQYQEVYEEEAAKSELWLQLVEARLTAGLTQKQMAERIGVSQAQVARIEKEDYDSYTLNTLRRYIAALGEGFSLEVTIHTPDEEQDKMVEFPHLTA